MHSTHDLLKTLVHENRIDNTYLFYGEAPSLMNEGAKEFARRLSCHSTPETCQGCTSCTTLATENHIDLLEINEDKSIKVDHIKDIQNQIKYGPAVERYKVIIIYNCELMTPEASNSFLKTLEDPPSKVVFILTTHHIKKIIPTIKSRSQSLFFKKQENSEPLANHIPLQILQKMPLFEKLMVANDLGQYSKANITDHIYSWINESIQHYPAQNKLHNRLISKIKTLSYNINLKLQIEELLITL